MSARGWVGMLISGIASIVMAFLIAAGWPAISVIVLGILLGVNFLSTGLAASSDPQCAEARAWTWLINARAATKGALRT